MLLKTKKIIVKSEPLIGKYYYFDVYLKDIKLYLFLHS